ncbi:MAG: hypothetical protein KAS49_04960, partial [Candidatus Cloacimonetes bacterium]|nr:hypothetical protein [Candidatus Cloacimonadota bacterium]
IRDNNENGSFDTQNGSGFGLDGVDPNRNYGFAWGFIGASGNPTYPTYHGPNKFSEPEIIAMKNLLENHHFIAGNSYHSYSELVLFPFGYNNNLHSPDHDALEELAVAMASTIPKKNGGTYDPSESWKLYPAMGTTDDYAYGQHGIFAYTIELGTEFIPPANQVTGICEDNLEAALILLDRASHNMVSGIITDAETNETVVAELFIKGIDDSEIFREPYKSNEQFGRYYRLLQSGTYDITFSAYGYKPFTAKNVQVSDSGITELDIQLSPSTADINISGFVFKEGVNIGVNHVAIEFLGIDLNTVYTDSEGYFSVNNLFEYNYDILIYTKNYETKYYTLQVSVENNTFDLDLASLNDGTFEDNTSGFYWNYGGNENWHITPQGYSSNYTFRSGKIFDKQNTSASLTINVLKSDKISFMKKVSSEVNYDFLRFFIDDKIMDQWSGEVGWSPAVYDIDAGIHTIKWEYTKNQTTSNGSDCAFIDNIEFPATFGVKTEEEPETTTPIARLKNYPNPFNSITTIQFSIEQQYQQIELEIYNIKGQKIKKFDIPLNLSSQAVEFEVFLEKTALETRDEKEVNSVIWDGKNNNGKLVSSGVYIYQLKLNGKAVANNKMLLIK